MTILQLAKKRYSVRNYQNKPVEQEKLETILEVGRVAPTAANKQPNIFLVINEPDALAKLQKACNPHGAPLAIIVCADQNTAWMRPFDNSSMVEIDASIATDHMMLAAEEMGLSSCWLTYFDPKVVRDEFNMPAGVVPVNILVIGYSGEQPQSPDRHTKTRNPLNTMVKYQTF